jgi:hypothetical protein
MGTEKSFDITISGQEMRFEIKSEGGLYYARPYVVSQRFLLPPVFYGVAKTPGKALEKCKEAVGSYLLALNDAIRSS